MDVNINTCYHGTKHTFYESTKTKTAGGVEIERPVVSKQQWDKIYEIAPLCTTDR